MVVHHVLRGLRLIKKKKKTCHSVVYIDYRCFKIRV